MLPAHSLRALHSHLVCARFKDAFGKHFGDKGYIGQTLGALLRAQDLQLVTKLKKEQESRIPN
jgi:hypothetical protein